MASQPLASGLFNLRTLKNVLTAGVKAILSVQHGGKTLGSVFYDAIIISLLLKATIANILPQRLANCLMIRRVFMVPLPRNPVFFGREEALIRMRAILSTPRCRNICELAGLPGIGKTQTALEYTTLPRIDHRHNPLTEWLGGQTIRLGPLQPEEGACLLLRGLSAFGGRVGTMDARTDHGLDVNNEDAPTFRKISIRVDGLPSMLQHMAGFLGACQLTPMELLQQWDTNRQLSQILCTSEAGSGPPSVHHYKEAPGVEWKLSEASLTPEGRSLVMLLGLVQTVDKTLLCQVYQCSRYYLDYLPVSFFKLLECLTT
ncbi:hypothetical protein B0H63DRAFT_522714 [Podospora didyma]|uniref:Uncharacterized protein n=1 Tax=Podospora didyma TaxID=330526 RepID=A0AAE0NPL5_9PEZI|nr:hypothetical protein B0H63DRAFT_522714 [Podospora didyma]